ncbi:hypothetical protein HX127_11450 [Acinetobacter sp. 256-1]|uniref:hypothetical protein n=1 Tax=Acinetobacter sp. 256-1 TaxID=2746721 RepID=UPI0025780BC9|nr:hypothetical protein [Acinetobacter sp. 256-1]MDM1758175.1 hypothetical protein [Acinetobacter sp. 256-1]
MVDKTEITHPIEIKDNSIERVAFDLMEKIAADEQYFSKNDALKENPRDYYLKLYNQCHKTVSRPSIDIDNLLQK